MFVVEGVLLFCKEPGFNVIHVFILYCSDIEFNKIDGKVDRCSAKHIIEKVGGFPR